MTAVHLLEAAAAATGLAGSFLLAINRPWSRYGWWAFLASNLAWIAFAWHFRHYAMLLQQLGFTATSLLGIWRWHLRHRWYWGEWRGDLAGNPTMHIMRLASWRGWRLDLHKMVGTDARGCYHTHPARALRFVTWGGYLEEIERSDGALQFKAWKPGMFGLVEPQLSHRIHHLRNERVSYSLWLRWPKSHDITLRGPGWPDGYGAIRPAGVKEGHRG